MNDFLFGNTNGKAIQTITKRKMQSDKKLNFYAVMAIFLTTLLLASIFSIGMSIFTSVETEKIRFMGTTAHAALGYPSDAQLKQLKGLDYVQAFGTNNHIAFIKDAPKASTSAIALHYFDAVEWESLRAPAYQEVAGYYPQQEDEIMVSKGVLKLWGIENPVLGMEIPLSFSTDDNSPNELTHMRFRLSGWYTSYALVYSRNQADVVLASAKLSDKYGKTAANSGSVSLLFDDATRVEQYCERLKIDLHTSDDQPIAAAQKSSSGGQDALTTVIALGALTAFIVFTGYLLIYNVLYISVSRDVRFYGLLKTLGATPKQIRRIILGQILRLSLIGIPVGALSAAGLSAVAIPAAISTLGIASTGAVVSFSPLIYLGAALFALLTALIGAIKPAKKAAAISPIEAQRFTGIEYKRNHSYTPIRGKTYKMALRNIFRDKKRAVLALLSLILGITTFTVVITLVSSMGMDGYIESMYQNDFTLLNDTLHTWHPNVQKFDQAFIARLEAMPGVEHMDYTLQEPVRLDYADETFGAYVKELLARDGNNMDAFTKEDIVRNFHGHILGISSAFLKGLNDEGLKGIDYNAFNRGEFALLCAKEAGLLADTATEVSLTPMKWSENGLQEIVGHGKVHIPVGAVAPSSLFVGGGLAPTVIVSQAYLRTLYDQPAVYELRLNVSDEYQRQTLQILKQMAQDDPEIAFTARIEAIEEMQGIITTLYVLGGGIACVIALVGILNFVNVMSVGVMARKQEFAVMESIGMSKKQMRSMLRYEGVGYAVITIACSMSVGNLLNYCLFLLFQRSAEYAVFRFPVMPVTVVCTFILLICILTTEVVYKGINNNTLAQRLRQAE